MTHCIRRPSLASLIGALAAFMLVLTGCGDAEDYGDRAQEHVVDEVAQFAGDPDVLFGLVSSLALDDEGALYVLDVQVPTVHALSHEGDVRATIGEGGEAPGEFQNPGAIGVHDDSVRVVDMMSSSISIFDREGAFGRTVPVERHSGGHVFGPNGYYAGANMGGDDSLAYVYDSTGEVLYGAGTPVNTGQLMLDMTAISEQIDSGEIPDIMADMTLLSADAEGGLWLMREASGEVTRYGPDGEQRWSTTLDVPEGEQILEQFFASNRENSNPGSFIPLRYLSDATAVGDELWVLVNTPSEAEQARIMVLSDDGSVRHHVLVLGAAAARSLAVDDDRGYIYLGVPSMAEVLSASIPEGVL